MIAKLSKIILYHKLNVYARISSFLNATDSYISYYLTGTAALSHVVEERVMREFHGVGKVGVREYDVRGFPSELQGYALHATGGAALNQFTDLRRAWEKYNV